MSKTLWSAVLVALVGATLLLTPATSEAQRRWGRGATWGGRGWDGGWGGVGVGIGAGYPGYYGGSSYGGYPRYYGYNNYSYPSYGYSYPTYGDQYAYPSSQFGSAQYSLYPSSQDTGSMGLTNPNDAGFVVRVPDPNAEVFFQDYKTQQRGMVRHFESDRLDPNQSYTFQIRARWMQNGQPVEQTRQVQARAGQNVTVDFASARTQQFQNQSLPNQQIPNQQLQNNQQFPNQVTPDQQAPSRQATPPNERLPNPPAKTEPGRASPTNEPQ